MNLNNLQLTVGIIIFDQMEVLDVAGPFEVFSVTRLNEDRRWKEPSPFRVILVSEKVGQVFAMGGLRFTSDVTFDNCPDPDLLIAPGGWETRMEVNNDTLLNWITARAHKTKLTASLCTGSSLLGKAGLLDGREATTHWRAFDFLGETAPKTKIRKDLLFTMVEPIFTSAGVSAGIDLALCIVSHFFGKEIAQPWPAKWNILIPKTIDTGMMLKGSGHADQFCITTVRKFSQDLVLILILY